MVVTPRQVVEFFHLVFLRALLSRGEDKALFALKGGCNLRFFFGSVRYSEDIDLDASVVSKGTLANKVDRLLKSPAIITPLRARGIDIAETSSPKQTDTTQRWKAGLSLDGRAPLVRTKIEFSRRDRIDASAFEAVDASVVKPYGLPRFLSSHYGLVQAIQQKVGALAGRSQPQARDVFDLNLLLSRREAPPGRDARIDTKLATRALEHAMSISFDDYASQVVAYLEPEQGEVFGHRAAWTAMQDDVVAWLEAHS